MSGYDLLTSSITSSVVLTLVALLFLGPREDQTTTAAAKARPPAQQKISSQLLYEIDRITQRVDPKTLPLEHAVVRVDKKQRAFVDVRAAVTPALTAQLKQLGGTIVSTSPEAQSVLAWVPLLSLERVAENPSVRAIEPAATAVTNAQPEKRK
jgi:hypothetical protein